MRPIILQQSGGDGGAERGSSPPESCMVSLGLRNLPAGHFETGPRFAAQLDEARTMKTSTQTWPDGAFSRVKNGGNPGEKRDSYKAATPPLSCDGLSKCTWLDAHRSDQCRPPCSSWFVPARRQPRAVTDATELSQRTRKLDPLSFHNAVYCESADRPAARASAKFAAGPLHARTAVTTSSVTGAPRGR